MVESEQYLPHQVFLHPFLLPTASNTCNMHLTTSTQAVSKDTESLGHKIYAVTLAVCIDVFMNVECTWTYSVHSFKPFLEASSKNIDS